MSSFGIKCGCIRPVFWQYISFASRCPWGPGQVPRVHWDAAGIHPEWKIWLREFASSYGLNSCIQYQVIFPKRNSISTDCPNQLQVAESNWAHRSKAFKPMVAARAGAWFLDAVPTQLYQGSRSKVLVTSWDALRLSEVTNIDRPYLQRHQQWKTTKLSSIWSHTIRPSASRHHRTSLGCAPSPPLRWHCDLEVGAFMRTGNIRRYSNHSGHVHGQAIVSCENTSTHHQFIHFTQFITVIWFILIQSNLYNPCCRWRQKSYRKPTSSNRHYEAWFDPILKPSTGFASFW